MKLKTKMRTRKVGARRLVVREDETVLGRQGEWLLVRIEGWSNSDWTSLKLFRHAEAPKNLWQLGVNAKGTRFAHNRDVRLLQEHHPEVAEWVLKTAGEAAERRSSRMAGGSNG